MTPKDIKIELIRADVTQADIAKKCKVSRTQVHRVITYHDCKSDHVRRAVAEAIGKRVDDVWPDHFGYRDVECARRAESIRPGSSGQCQSRCQK